MTDDEIRALVRMAIQKHLGGAPAVAMEAVVVSAPPVAPANLSFARYLLPRAEDDTMCLIEPEVRCNHCGYCQCHGH
ncbi:MAG: hypothetical protein ABI665_12230 [Vicinamibacterales bacterium]